MPEVMEEKIVQWFLSKDQDYFAKLMNLPLLKCLGTEVTVKYGRVDFLYKLDDKRLLVVELETGVNSTSKLEHCISQTKNYLKLKTGSNKQKLEVALVYAFDKTSEKYRQELINHATENGIILRSYSIQKILQLYNRMVNQLNYTSGVSLGRAVALGITSITWLKKFMLPFLIINNSTNLDDSKKLIESIWTEQRAENYNQCTFSDFELVDKISWVALKDMFSSNTNFYVLKRLVEDFELIQIKLNKKNRIVTLTDYGQKFLNDLYIHSQFENEEGQIVISKELSQVQKRLLLEILLNGNLTKIKVNIFHFLRFVHLTEGVWLPKQGTKLSSAERQYLNNLFKSSYNARTLKELILQTCTFCIELGLVEKLPIKDQLYDQVIFTSLGSRVYNYFEQLLHVERERHQIPLQIK